MYVLSLSELRVFVRSKEYKTNEPVYCYISQYNLRKMLYYISVSKKKQITFWYH